MTLKRNLGVRLTQVDDLTRPDHYYLTAEDQCLYFGEYTARKGFNHSETNQLILNFKKKMDRRGLLEWRYKTAAIDTAGSRPLTFQYLPQKVALTRTMMIAF